MENKKRERKREREKKEQNWKRRILNGVLCRPCSLLTKGVCIRNAKHIRRIYSYILCSVYMCIPCIYVNKNMFKHSRTIYAMCIKMTIKYNVNGLIIWFWKRIAQIDEIHAYGHAYTNYQYLYLHIICIRLYIYSISQLWFFFRIYTIHKPLESQIQTHTHSLFILCFCYTYIKCSVHLNFVPNDFDQLNIRLYLGILVVCLSIVFSVKLTYLFVSHVVPQENISILRRWFIKSENRLKNFVCPKSFPKKEKKLTNIAFILYTYVFSCFQIDQKRWYVVHKRNIYIYIFYD